MISLQTLHGSLRTGSLVGGRFSIRRVAGEGGMGVVYRAEDNSTGKTVALKILTSKADEDRARFFREAQVLSSVAHPAIVGCLDHGALPTGELWIAMEWVEGEDLATRLERGPLAPREALIIARSIASALGAAHEQGIVHRDVKPANIILEGGDPARARLIDFGVARWKSVQTFTEYGAILGTPAYMAPEQIRGASEADGRADLYALGVILFECVTLQLPFISASFIGTMTQALFEAPPNLRDLNPSLSPALEALVAALLEKDPAKRLGPASALLDALDAPDLDHLASQPPPRRVPTGLSEEELRFVSVVLIAHEALPSTHMTNDTLVDRFEGQLLRHVERIATSHQGHAEGLRDGTVLIAFPARGAATDQAAMAARTALAIRNLGSGRPIALATGRSSANVGSLYSDAATRAASLTKLCVHQEMSIVIDETTRGLLDARFSVEQGQGVSYLLAEDPFGEAGRLLCGRSAPFVGREREVGLIEKIFDDVVQESQTAAIVVVGEAGAGKSRLGREVLATLSRIEPKTEIWIARGEAVRAGSSFGMLASALQRAAGILEGEAPEIRHQKLAEFVKERVPHGNAASIIMFLGEIVDAKVATDNDELRAARRDPVLMRDRIRFAVEDLIEAVTAQRPVALVLEDLHWGDVPSIRVLEMAYRRLRHTPLFLMAMGRQEMSELFPNLFVDWSPSTIRLSGLSRRACQSLIHRILGESVNAELVASIVERSAGHPLFLEEIVRSISENATATMTTLPETVLAMVQSRMAKLPAEARRVLRAASVFGEVFWQDGVAALLGQTDLAEQVTSWLRTLRDHEFVEPKRTSRFSSQVEYGFRHALLRESAYAMLTDADKTTGHALAATFLEQIGETNAPLLATHFDLAQQPLQAAPYHVRAAREALLGDDHDRVFHHADHVIQSGIDGPLLGEALAIRAEAMQWRGMYESLNSVLESALTKLEPGTASWFGAITTLAMNSVRRIQIDKLEPLCKTLATWGENHEWSAAFVEAAIRTGIQAFIGGQYQIALSLLGPVNQRFSNATDCEPRTQAFLELLRGVVSSRGWHYDQTIEHSTRAAEFFEQVGDVRSAAGQKLDNTFTLIDLGQFERAAVLCQEIMSIADRLVVPRLKSLAIAMLGSARMGQGRYDEALQTLIDAKDKLDALGDKRNSGSTRNKLGRCYRLRKEYSQAETVLNEAEIMLDALPRIRAMCHANKALLYVEMGRATDAMDQALMGMKVLDQLGRIGTDEILVRYALIESLKINQRNDEAASELAVARQRLDWIANQLTTDEVRQVFLTKVDENRRVLEMQCP